MSDYLPELIFDEPGLRGPKGEDGDAPSLTVAKIAPYLYTVEYKDWDYLNAMLYADEIANVGSGCSAIINGELVGHNSDSGYDERAEFIVKTIASKGRHASVGVASVPSYLKAAYVDSGVKTEETDRGYKILPFMTVDGVNDAGLACVANSVQADYGRTTGTNPDGDDMPEFALVRFMLDYAGSVDEAVELLYDLNVFMPESDTIKDEFYLLISDPTRTVRVEFIRGNVIVTDLAENSKIVATNFFLHGYDGTVESLQPHANGVERYNILDAGFESANTEEGMISLLKSVRYTNKYHATINPFWYSDYRRDWSDHGWGDITKDSPIEDYSNPISYSVDKYYERERDGESDHTVHTVVYNKATKSMTILVQEVDKEYNYCMDLIPFIEGESARAQAAEESIRNELRNGYYTIEETDNVIAETEERILDNVAESYYSKEQVNSIATSLREAIEEEHSEITEETDEKLDLKLDKPVNDGDVGQILTKIQDGSEWKNPPRALPDVATEDNDKIMVVENGEWILSDKFADYIRYINLMVNITSDNGGVCHGGLFITVKNADTGDVINVYEFKGQPVTFRVPRGMHYEVTQDGIWEGYHNPTPDKIEGAATVDATLVFTYEAIRVPETLRELQIIVDGGGAASLANHIGLQFADTYDYNGVEYDIIWDLKAVIPVIGGDGEEHTGVVLEWHNSTPNAMPFDAPERLQVDLSQKPYAEEGLYYYGLTGNTYKLLNVSAGELLPTTYDGVFVNAVRSTDASVIRRGYGKYSESAVRKWLNSEAGPGEWFYSSHVGDVAPTQADEIPGFICGCSEQILSMAKPVEYETADAARTYYKLVDRFFIPSVTEVYGVHDEVTEGVAWPDWIDATGFSMPSNDACAGRRIYAPGTLGAQEIGLRTANVGYQYIVWDIKPDGSIDGYTNASLSKKYTPCCVIY